MHIWEGEQILLEKVKEFVEGFIDWENCLSVRLFKFDIKGRDTYRESFTIEVCGKDLHTFVITKVEGFNFLLIDSFSPGHSWSPSKRNILDGGVICSIDQELLKVKEASAFVDFDETTGVYIFKSTLRDNDTGDEFPMTKCMYKVKGSTATYFCDMPEEEVLKSLLYEESKRYDK